MPAIAGRHTGSSGAASTAARPHRIAAKAAPRNPFEAGVQQAGQGEEGAGDEEGDVKRGAQARHAHPGLREGEQEDQEQVGQREERASFSDSAPLRQATSRRTPTTRLAAATARGSTGQLARGDQGRDWITPSGSPRNSCENRKDGMKKKNLPVTSQ